MEESIKLKKDVLDQVCRTEIHSTKRLEGVSNEV